LILDFELALIQINYISSTLPKHSMSKVKCALSDVEDSAFLVKPSLCSALTICD
jgi:hypothetical protein